MRLGVIEFGAPIARTASLLEALRDREVDVIVALEEPPRTVRDPAQRLARADCDGVLFTLGEGASSDDIAEAVLYVHAPLLVVGVPPADESEPLHRAWHVIRQVAVTHDLLSPPDATPDAVESWLRENARKVRQGGVEAAHKLYGTRLFVGATDSVDKLLWLRQFGILIRDQPTPDDVRPDDIHAVNGDLVGALAERLLRLVSASEEVHAVAADELGDGEVITMVRIAAPSAPSARFVCTIARGTIGESGRAGFYAVAGDHVGAMRAACDALDIVADVSRPSSHP